MMGVARHTLSLLREMGPGWVAFRAGYAAKRRTGWLERRCPAAGWPGLRQVVTVDVAPEELSRQLRHLALPFGAASLADRQRFVRDVVTTPGVHALVDEIELAQRGTWRLFGNVRQPVKWPPAWHQHPISGTEWPRVHWSRLADTDATDVKWLWELGRFGVAFSLVRAAWLTGQPAYAESFWRLVESWRDDNPPNIGVHWMCGQECAFRTIAWTFALLALIDAEPSTPERVATLVEMLAVHGERIEGNLAYARSQKNNHAVNEGLALWTLGTAFPMLRSAARWEAVGRQLLEEEAVRQFYADGSYVQHSLNYECLVLQSYAWALEMGRATGRSFSGALLDRYERAVHFLYQLVDPVTGRMPNYGANDGSRLFRLDSCAPDDARPTLALAFWAAERRRVFEPGPWDEPLFWLAIANPDAPVRPAERIDLAADAAGYYTLHAGDSWAFTRCGTYRDRPSQADMLHVDLWWRGENIVGDPGTFAYTGLPPWDNGLAATLVHNTVTVDDCDQMERLARFAWVQWNRGRLIRREADARSALKLMEGEHQGYCRLGGVRHRRAILAVAGRAWIIVDDVLGSDVRRLSSQWLFPHAHIAAGGGNTWLVETKAGRVSVSFFSFDAASSSGSPTLEVTESDGQGTLGWFSPTYGQRQPVPALLASEVSPLPVRRITAIVLGAKNAAILAADPTVFRLMLEEGNTFEATWRPFPYAASDSLVESAQLRSAARVWSLNAADAPVIERTEAARACTRRST